MELRKPRYQNELDATKKSVVRPAFGANANEQVYSGAGRTAVTAPEG
jgi:hypothetical protein